MPVNDPEYQRTYHANHYQEHKAKYIAQAAARRAQLKAEIDDLKRQPCADCGGTFNPWQMDFDHRDGTDKTACIAKLVGNNQRKKVYEEIKKCDLVCANCHRDRTHQRMWC